MAGVSVGMVTPLADGAIGVGWLLAGQGDDLAHLLGRELRRGAGLRRIRQPFGHTDFLQGHVLELQPASSPVTWRLIIDAQLPSDLQVVPPVACQQHDPRAQGDLLGRRVGPHQAFQSRVPAHSASLSEVSACHLLFRSTQDA